MTVWKKSLPGIREAAETSVGQVDIVLFRTDAHFGDVLIHRVGDRTPLQRMPSVLPLLELSGGELAELRDPWSTQKTFIMDARNVSMVTVALKDDTTAGLYLFAPGSEKKEELWWLLHDLQSERMARASDGTVSLRELRMRIRSLAAFAGCGLTTVPPEADPKGDTVTRLRCGMTRMPVCLLLSMFLEAREFSRDRKAALRLESADGREGGNLLLSLEYTVCLDVLDSDAGKRMEELHTYWSDRATLLGFELWYSPYFPCNGAVSDREYVQTVRLEWYSDPTVLPSQDLKADPEGKWRKRTGRNGR